MADEQKSDDFTKELLKRYNIAEPEGTLETAPRSQTYNPFLESAFEDEKTKPSLEDALPGAGVGAALGYGASGARLNPLSPSAKTITNSAVTPFVERGMKLPPGQIGGIYEMMKPAAPSLTSAARQVVSYPEGIPTSAQTQRILGGTIDDTYGTTGRARTGGFNEETQRLTRAQAEREKILDSLRQRGLISNVDPLVSAGTMTKTPSGISIPLTAAPQAAPPPRPPQAAAVDNAVQKAKTASKIAGGLSVAGKTLTGAGAGLGALDAYNRYKAGDTSGAVISGLTAAASIPFPLIATAIGVPLQWVHDNPEEARAMYQQAKTILSNPQSYQYPSEAMQ
jgi:hypothetical protein